MGIFSKFERGIEDGLEGAASKMFDAPISPVQISKKAERAMRREKMVGAGKQYAPTLYTILVNPDDDQRLFGYYPTLAGETETYLAARASEEGLAMDGQPLVRFIVDESLKHGKFDVIAELVSAPIVAQLRREEMQRYGLLGSAGQAKAQAKPQQTPRSAVQQNAQAAAAIASEQIPSPTHDIVQPAQTSEADLDALDSPDDIEDNDAADEQSWRKQPLPYVPENEIDRTIDYGEYTFNSQDFEDYEEHGPSARPVSAPVQQDEPTSYTSEELKATYDAYDNQDIDDQDISDADLSGFDVEVYTPGAFDSRDIRDVPSSAPATTAFTGNGAVQVDNTGFSRLKDLSANRTYELASSRIIMGRSHSCDIVVDDINASRSHAELRHEAQGEWIITDLGSTNGTTVNGEYITSHLLVEGDRISIGTTEFVFL